MATRAAGKIDAGEFKQQVFGCENGGLRQGRSKFEQFTALSERLFFRAVGEKAEVTDAHEPVGQDMEQEAADEFVGVKVALSVLSGLNNWNDLKDSERLRGVG